VREVNCNVPYHSSYLTSVKAQLLLNLNKIIPQPKKRSPKWISTSISHPNGLIQPQNYHRRTIRTYTHSIVNTVLFKQMTQLIPRNAVTIEIGPDGILQHILKECLHPDITNIVLTQSSEKNNDVIF